MTTFTVSAGDMVTMTNCRHARKGHVHDIPFLLEAIEAITPRNVPTYRELERAIFDERMQVYVLQKDGKARLITAVQMDERDALITTFYRSKDAPPLGLKGEAETLLRFMLDDLKRHGVQNVALYVNLLNPAHKKLIRFYERLGFSEPDMVRMKRSI